MSSANILVQAQGKPEPATRANTSWERNEESVLAFILVFANEMRYFIYFVFL